MAENMLPNIDSLWNYYKPEETFLKFSELIPLAKMSENTAYYAVLLTQLARTQSLQSKFDQAHEYLNEVEILLKSNDFKKVQVRYLLERGRTYNSNKQTELAIPLFNEAFTLAVKNDFDFYAVDAAHMLAITSPVADQMHWNLKAMELAEKSEDPKAQNWLGSLYNNIGWTYFDLKEYSNALELFQKALDWRIKQKEEKSIFIATWCIGRVYRAMERIEEALNIQLLLLDEIQSNKMETDGFVFEELGECYYQLNEIEKSKSFFKEAYALLSKDEWFKNNEKERLQRLLTLSK